MTIYRISAEKARIEKSKALRRSAWITTISLVFGFLLGGRFLFRENNRIVFIFGIVVLGLVLTVSLWRSLSRTKQFLAEAYSSFEISSDDQVLIKTQKNTPLVTLARSEIKRVEEAEGKGFRICTAERFKNIWVPCELDGYDQLRAEILALPGVELTTKSAAWLKSYLVLGAFLLVFAISILASDKRVASATSVVLAGYLFFTFFSHYRNPNLTTRGKRVLLWNPVAAIILLARAVIVWRG